MGVPIIDNQRDTLDSLICERLSSNPDNKDVIKTLFSGRNPKLVEKIQREDSWKEDEANITSYYLVKTKSGIVLAFFALRCGEIFKPVQEELIERAKLYIENKAILEDTKTGYEEKRKAADVIILLVRQGWTDKIAKAFMRKAARRAADAKRDSNKHTHRVSEVLSAVELTLFCNNDANGVKEEWANLGLPQRRGASIFWHLIMPKIQYLTNVVGCEYLYLFAADDDSDGTLVNYYKDAFHFTSPVDMGSNKPTFDYGCFFLCQQVNVLLQYSQYFYDHFNPDANAV